MSEFLFEVDWRAQTARADVCSRAAIACHTCWRTILMILAEADGALRRHDINSKLGDQQN